MSNNLERFFTGYLVFTAMLCGGLVMLIEVLGSRVIGPFFGVGLFVWTSIITVALLALAAGYIVGGKLADKRRSPSFLYGIIIIAGLLVLMIPYLSSPVLKFSQPLGLRVGTLVATALLFTPSLFLLGFVSPYIIKIAAQKFDALGATVGRFYALSTFGSCLGTLLTGFYLIPQMGVQSILFLAGGLLCGLGLGYFVLFQRKWQLAPVMIVPFLLGAPVGVDSKVLADGTQVTKLTEVDSYYGNIKVLEYRFDDEGIREMQIDGLIQGGSDLVNGKSAYSYPYFMMFLPTALHPKGKSSLTIGVGAGFIPRWYSERGYQSDVVDIDPEVVTLAKQYFDFAVSGEVFIEDARYFLTRTTKSYDYILLDVFSGDTTPGHVLTAEAMALVRQRLSASGIFAANLVGDLSAGAVATSALLKTVGSQFEQVELYPTFELSAANKTGNYVLIAYQGEKRTLQNKPWQSETISKYAQSEVLSFIGRQYLFDVSPDAIMLTDDYNPIEFMEAKFREQVRIGIINSTDADMLL